MTFQRRTPSSSDERGHILDIVQDEAFEHATFIMSVKHSVRGNHYHKHTTQAVFVLSGMLLLSWRGAEDTIAQQRVLYPWDLVVHPPNERHSLTALEDSTFLVLTQGPRGGDHYESDTFRETV